MVNNRYIVKEIKGCKNELGGPLYTLILKELGKPMRILATMSDYLSLVSTVKRKIMANDVYIELNWYQSEKRYHASIQTAEKFMLEQFRCVLFDKGFKTKLVINDKLKR
jgi:hypothetical protein